MKEKSAALLLCVSGIFCVFICILAGYTSVSGELPNFFPTPTFTSSLQNATNETPIKKEETDEDKPNETTSKTESAVTTATKENALGAIKETFYSSAKINSNNVQINNKTDVSIGVSEFLKAKIPFKIEKKLPQVLIIHTHTTESYMRENRDFYTATDATHSNSEDKNMVAIGAVFVQKLTKAKIGVVHCKTVHDSPSYSGSYDKSAQSVEKILKENPSIKVIIDIHRDSISDGSGGKLKPVCTVGGKKAAQVMLVMGNNFETWKNNFAFAVKFHQTMQVMYPGLARPISLYNKKYNQNLSNGALLLEVGTDANTLEEALYAAELSANALVSLLNTLK